VSKWYRDHLLTDLARAPRSTVFPNQTWRAYLKVSCLQAEEAQSYDLEQATVVENLAKLVQDQHNIEAMTEKSITLSAISGFSPAYAAARPAMRLQRLRQSYPTISEDILRSIFPLYDPLDLDVVLSWNVRSNGSSDVRKGCTILPAVRPAPEFSIVEKVRQEVDAAIAAGGKKTRTMYEETGRLRRLLMDSVLDGSLAVEDDPVSVHLQVNGQPLSRPVSLDNVDGCVFWFPPNNIN
jgi:hypothetical protein